MRLIDADKLEIIKITEFTDETGDSIPVYGVTADDIANAPTVDAIVPPVKVGQTVWYITGIYGTLIKAADVHGVYYHGSGWTITLKNDNNLIFKIEWGVDKVYITREAAEEALKAREYEKNH